MTYLLDTDSFIFLIRGLKPSRRPGIRRDATALLGRCREAQAGGHTVGLSAITVSELEFGARCSDDYEAEIAAVQKLLVPFDVFDYDATGCPSHYGRIRRELEKEGTPIGAMDLLIAAHALALDATLVSNNLAHFSRVRGIKTVNWVRNV